MKRFATAARIIRLTLAICALSAYASMANATTDNKRILLLFTNASHQEGAKVVEDAIRSTLHSDSPKAPEIYSEYLDAIRTPLSKYDKELIEYLKRKYGDRKFDLILCINAPALQFALQNRDTVFANAPVVFLVLDRQNVAGIDVGTNVTGVWGETNYRATVDMALSLHPGTKRVVVISGVGEWDNYWRMEVQRQFRPLEGTIEFSYLTGLTISEQKTALASLPPQTVVIFVSSTQDRNGENASNLDVLRQIAPTSRAPMYGGSDAQLGLGIVGGKLLSLRALGEEGGRVGLRVLAGETPGQIPPHGVPGIAMFDWRELNRWGLHEKSLPPNSVVLFKERTLWEQYKWVLLGLLAAILLEAALIARLLFTQEKRRQAERETKRLNALAVQTHRRLQETVSNVPGMVWETVIDPETKERKTTFISDYVRTVLGYTPEEWLAQPPGFGLQIMAEEDRERVIADSEAAIASGKDTITEHRWRAKDGRLVWIESHLSPILTTNGAAEGLRGVSLDITERKLAEAAVKMTEEKDRAILEAIPDLMFLQTPDGVYLDLHYRDPTNLFVPPKDYLGRNMSQILPPDLAARFGDCFQRTIATGKPQRIEYELTIKGERRWYESRVVRCGENILSVVRDITERREAERALSESERRLRLAQEAARVGTWEWNVTTGESVWSEMIWELLGLERATKPMHVDDFVALIHPEDRERVWAKVNDAIVSGNEYYDEFRIVRPDGQVAWLSSQGRVFRSANGTAERMIGVNIDISRRKLAEETARETEQKDTAILNAIPDLMFLQTRDGVYLDYHTKNEKDLFVPPAEFLGKSMWDVLPADLATVFAGCFERAEKSNEPQIVEYRIPRNGSEFWYEARIVRSGENILSVVRDITDRRLTEAALKDSELNYRSIFNAANDAIFVHDMKTGAILDVNLRMCEMYGCTVDKARQLTVADFSSNVAPYTDKEVGEFVQKAAGGTAQLFEWHARKLTGELFWVEVSLRRVSISGNECILAIVRDITERKRALDDLRQSEQRFGKAFQANPQPMSITRIADGLYIDVNESFLELSGYTREEVVGHTSLELMVWETPEVRKEFIQKLLHEGSVVNQEMKFRTKNGSFRTFLSSAERLNLGGEECLLVASSDITERMAAQQALTESEARFRNMADTAPVLIWMSNTENRCIYVNQQWLDFTGRTIENELGEGWIEGIHSEDQKRCVNSYAEAFVGREPFRLEYRLRRFDGQYRWVIDTGTPRLSSTGKFLGYIGSCVDITDRKESEIAVAHAHEELVTAHDEVQKLKAQLEEENIYLQEEIRQAKNLGEMVGDSDAIKYVMFKVSHVAVTDSTVLITGETGTGKELVARAIHSASARSDRSLITVNCAALPATLIESELFGHEKGAFTGAAARKPGRFELADGGTIFLDEVGELPLESQVKLLRVIQEGEVQRLGSTNPIKVDVRIIAATNRNLKREIERGAFREDLWYRLNVFPITVPPLRQRTEDIPLLVEHFVANYANKFGKTITSISPQAMQKLREHSWPGNVRELANVIERAVIYTQGNVLTVVDIFEQAKEQVESSLTLKSLEEVEREYILHILEHTSWRIEGPRGAAKLLGMNPSTLRTRMIKLGIHKNNALSN